MIQAENGVVYMTGIFRSSAGDVDALYVAADEAVATILPHYLTLEGWLDKRVRLAAIVRPTDPVLLAEAEKAIWSLFPHIRNESILFDSPTAKSS